MAAFKKFKKQKRNLRNMSLFGVFYEFEVSRQNIKYLVDALGITQKGATAVSDVAENLIDLIKRGEGTYAKVEVCDKLGLMLRFSRGLRAEGLPHPIEGAYAFIHPSSEGHLELVEFKTYFETALSARGIPYVKYD